MGMEIQKLNCELSRDATTESRNDMKQFNIEIDQNSSQIEKVSVNAGEYFCIQTTYRDWTLNKAQANFQFYTEDGKPVEKEIEMTSYDEENNVVVMMHFMDKFESNAKLVLKTNAGEAVEHPNIWVNVEVSCPTLVCNNAVYEQKSIIPTVYNPRIVNGGALYLDSMLAKHNTLSVQMGHEGSKGARLNIYDGSTLSSLFEVRNFAEKKIGNNVLKTNGSQISMNPDKLLLNGQEVKVKEVTIGEETLSVLQVV